MDRIGEDGELARVQERIYLGVCAEMMKRAALKARTAAMAKVNQSQYVIQAQVPFGDFLAQYEREHVLKPENLATSTQAKYLSHIKSHIRPAFNALPMAEVTTARIDAWLGQKAKDGMSWATRMDLRNLMCGIFSQAEKWGYWKERNPTLYVTVGRKRAELERHKLTAEQTRQLLDALPCDVRIICEVALYCTLRISEVLGLQWHHIDFKRGVLCVRQRFYRGDLDIVKSDRAARDIPMGALGADLVTIYPGKGHETDYVFSVHTHLKHEKVGRITRDDRSINQHFVRPAAKALAARGRGRFSNGDLRRNVQK